MKLTRFQDIKSEVRRRVATRQWAPGALIPNEQDLAQEFGCARATVNRALRELADHGLLERRRKAGTRVVVNPVSKATLTIAIMRQTIQQRGLTYGYRLLSRAHVAPPAEFAHGWGVTVGRKMLHLVSLHLGDDAPFALEDRWINTGHVRSALDADFGRHNANEWLVQNAPYSHGDVTLSACNAGAFECRHLAVAPGTACLVMDRKTWDGDAPVTTVRIWHAPGYRMDTGG